MALAEEDIAQIQQMIISAVNTPKQNSEPVLSNVRYELEIRERVIRVEEELKNQRELIHQVLHQMDKRFEQVDKRMEQSKHEMEKRFEQVDQRIEQSKHEMEKHFEQVDKRIEQSKNEMEKRIEQSQNEMEKRFEQVDKRFEQVDKRFAAMEKQFELVINRLDRFMFWSLMLTCSAVFVVVKLV